MGLAAFLWLQLDTGTNQTHALLDEVVSDAYTILQSEKEANGKTLLRKKQRSTTYSMPMSKSVRTMRILWS